jgi:hypothetical protein
VAILDLGRGCSNSGCHNFILDSSVFYTFHDRQAGSRTNFSQFDSGIDTSLPTFHRHSNHVLIPLHIGLERNNDKITYSSLEKEMNGASDAQLNGCSHFLSLLRCPRRTNLKGRRDDLGKAIERNQEGCHLARKSKMLVNWGEI